MDTIKTDGRFTLKVTKDGEEYTAAQLVAAGYTITWTKTKDSTSSSVTRREVTEGVYNMDADGQWVNVVYDKGSQASYTVTVSKEGTTSLTADKTVAYYDSLQNGSFEEPVLGYPNSPSGTWFMNGIVQTHQDNVPGWKTTASDSKIELGNVTKRQQGGSVTEQFYHCSETVDGDQIAELNATQTSALYQDVLTEPGAKMNWRLAHRGREGSDTMALVIAPLSKVESITTQQQLEDFIRDHESDGDVFVWRMTDGNTAWGEYSGTMDVPQGQYLTRFFFVAISTATPDKTVGNLLDNVWFSTELPPPSPGTGRITVTKNVYGLDLATAKEKLTESFISYSGPDSASGRVTFDAENWQEKFDGTGTKYVTASFVIDIASIASDQTLTYTFTEDAGTESPAQVDGYTLTPDDQLTKTVSLTKENNNKSVAYTNIYARLTVKKLVTGGLGDKTKEFSFTYRYQKDGQGVTGTFTLKDGKTKEITGIPLGTPVTITEDDYSTSGYATSYQKGGADAETGRECTVTIAAGDNVVTFTNNREASPDVGILLDSWPYLVVLAVVVAGTVVFWVLRRRRRDDD